MIIHREFLSCEIAKNSVKKNSRLEIEKKSFKIDNCGSIRTRQKSENLSTHLFKRHI